MSVYGALRYYQLAGLHPEDLCRVYFSVQGTPAVFQKIDPDFVSFRVIHKAVEVHSDCFEVVESPELRINQVTLVNVSLAQRSITSLLYMRKAQRYCKHFKSRGVSVHLAWYMPHVLYLPAGPTAAFGRLTLKG